MQRLTLTGGTYQARYSAIAAQRCLNLYPEPLPQEQEEPLSYAALPTPGLVKKTQATGSVRCLYTTSQGDLLVVIGNTLYYVAPDARLKKLATLSDGTTPVQMSDNSTCLFIVDGASKRGWYGAIPPHGGTGDFGVVSELHDEAYYGSSTIALLDSFFLFVQDGTAHWYTSPAQFQDEKTTPFDSLYIASAATSMATISAVQVLGQTIWVFGRSQTELWSESGASDFPFQRISGVTVECGCLSPFSIARCPTTTNLPNGGMIWLGGDRSGRPRVYMGQQTQALPISTYAIDLMLQQGSAISQAVGSVYQQDGHLFYVLTLPGQSSSFVYDISTNLWHERCSLDSNGNEAPYRVTQFAEAYGAVWAGGADGALYHVDLNSGDEDGTPIKRQRSFPHLLTNGQRNIHRQLMVDMPNGGGQTVMVDWSDDRGASFCSARALPLGTTSNIWPSLWRLGIARDRVYRLTWTSSSSTALMGVFLQIDPVAT